MKKGIVLLVLFCFLFGNLAISQKAISKAQFLLELATSLNEPHPVVLIYSNDYHLYEEIQKEIKKEPVSYAGIKVEIDNEALQVLKADIVYYNAVEENGSGKLMPLISKGKGLLVAEGYEYATPCNVLFFAIDKMFVTVKDSRSQIGSIFYKTPKWVICKNAEQWQQAMDGEVISSQSVIAETPKPTKEQNAQHLMVKEILNEQSSIINKQQNQLEKHQKELSDQKAKLYKQSQELGEKSSFIEEQLKKIEQQQGELKALADSFNSREEMVDAQKKSLELMQKQIKLQDRFLADRMQELKEKEVQVFNAEKVLGSFERKLLGMTEVVSFQRLVLIIVVLFLIIAGILGVFLFKSNALNKKRKEELQLQYDQITRQREEIKKKNDQLLDSLQYASTIQSSLLTGQELIKEFVSESFLFYQPRDIVSGDFYWAETIVEQGKKQLLFAVADCTGHGVPGALMSMLGISFLNEIVNEKKVFSPAAILNELRTRVINAFRNKPSHYHGKDGMDLSIIKYDPESKELTYAAAFNGIYLFRNNQVIDLPAQKMPVGLNEIMDPFIEERLFLSNGDVLVMYTDGYADQFGGPKGKKFKYVNLEKVISNHLCKSLNEVGVEVTNAMRNWMSSETGKQYEQIDDMCVIGIKV